jgi:hypothetical protein
VEVPNIPHEVANFMLGHAIGDDLIDVGVLVPCGASSMFLLVLPPPSTFILPT